MNNDNINSMDELTDLSNEITYDNYGRPISEERYKFTKGDIENFVSDYGLDELEGMEEMEGYDLYKSSDKKKFARDHAEGTMRGMLRMLKFRGTHDWDIPRNKAGKIQWEEVGKLYSKSEHLEEPHASAAFKRDATYGLAREFWGKALNEKKPEDKVMDSWKEGDSKSNIIGQ